jgi:hypothetical protein
VALPVDRGAPPPATEPEITALVDTLRGQGFDHALVLTSLHQSPLPTALRIAGAAGFALPEEDAGRLAIRPPPAPRLVGAGGCVVVHPGASVPTRAMPAWHCAEAVRLLDSRGLRVVVTGGPGERALTSAVGAARGTVGGVTARPLRILHLHGSWTEALVRGGHHYLLPTRAEGGPWGLGKAGRDWPGAREVPVEHLAETDVDAVILQREEEVPLVHVTHFNAGMWDSGRAPVSVIEHGIPDPGPRYTGELARVAVVVDEPVRRWRCTGTALLGSLARGAPLEVFGMGLDGPAGATGLEEPALRALGDLGTEKLHGEMARRRLYLHPFRWTSLGLALIEAMHLGMPAVGLAATEAVETVPHGTGVLSTDLDTLTAAMRELVAGPQRARHMGARGGKAALRRYGLGRFLADWDRLLAEVTR